MGQVQVGDRFGFLTVVAVGSALDSRGWKEHRAVVICDCGTEKNVASRTLDAAKSCGCSRIKPMPDPLSLKRCSGCKTEKPRTEFSQNKRTKDGLNRICKSCDRKKYEANREVRIAQASANAAKSPERRREITREWRRRNAERENEKYRERISNDPEFLRSVRSSSVRSEGKRRAAKRRAEVGAITDADLQRILEEYKGRCWICHADLADMKIHWDHYRPLSKGGSHVLDNLRPACKPCNLSKHARWPLTDDILEDIRIESARKRAAA